MPMFIPKAKAMPARRDPFPAPPPTMAATPTSATAPAVISRRSGTSPIQAQATSAVTKGTVA